MYAYTYTYKIRYNLKIQSLVSHKGHYINEKRQTFFNTV